MLNTIDEVLNAVILICFHNEIICLNSNTLCPVRPTQTALSRSGWLLFPHLPARDAELIEQF